MAKILGQGGKIMRKDLESRYQEFGRNNLAILILGTILVKIVHKIFFAGQDHEPPTAPSAPP